MSSQVAQELLMKESDEDFCFKVDFPIDPSFCGSIEEVWKHSMVPHGVDVRLVPHQDGFGKSIYVTKEGHEQIQAQKKQAFNARVKSEFPAIVFMLIASAFVSLMFGLFWTLLIRFFGPGTNLLNHFLVSGGIVLSICLIGVAIAAAVKIFK